MRCRAGDLAVILRSDAAENVGRFVTCVSLLPLTERQGIAGFIDPEGRLYPALQFSGSVWLVETCGGDLTVIDLMTQRKYPTQAVIVADNDLRPIRDNDGVDETLLNLEFIV